MPRSFSPTLTGVVIHTVTAAAQALDARLRPAFGPETAAGGWFRPEAPSAGHCAAVAAVAAVALRADLACPLGDEYEVGYASTKVDGASHWFSRVTHRPSGLALDVDLTGDQFGRPAIQVRVVGDHGAPLYPETRVREGRDLNDETRRRAALLAERAGCQAAAAALRDALAAAG